MRVLGIGTASAPLAAKAALEKETISLMQPGYQIASGAYNIMPPYVGHGQLANHSNESIHAKMSDYIRLFGYPAHVMDQCWSEAKWVNAIDFDIANKRSWSLAAKIHEQRQRNFQRRLDQMKNGGMVEKVRDSFFERFGFNFLW